MARRIHRGRFTAAHDGEIVVFLIGMRVNKPWKVRAWWPVFTAMPSMLKELSQDPDSGLLGVRVLLRAAHRDARAVLGVGREAAGLRR